MALFAEHRPQDVDHDSVDDGEGVDDELHVGQFLQVQQTQELSEKLLELLVVVEFSLRLCVRCK